jgi:hypothetical protein
MSSLPLQFLLLTIAGWMTRDHQRVAAYLLAENAVLREQLRDDESSTPMPNDADWPPQQRSSGAKRSASSTLW